MPIKVNIANKEKELSWDDVKSGDIVEYRDRGMNPQVVYAGVMITSPSGNHTVTNLGISNVRYPENLPVFSGVLDKNFKLRTVLLVNHGRLSITFD